MKLLDFYADWCAPCKSLSPIIDKITEEEKIEITKINIEDDTDDLSGKYKVRGIPTVILLDDDDTELRRFTGFKSENDVRSFING